MQIMAPVQQRGLRKTILNPDNTTNHNHAYTVVRAAKLCFTI